LANDLGNGHVCSCSACDRIVDGSFSNGHVFHHDFDRPNFVYHFRRGELSSFLNNFKSLFQTAVENMKRSRGKLAAKAANAQKPTPVALLRGVFGPGAYWTWLIPIPKRSTSYVHLI
jgi:hypothetical protein